MVDREAVWFGDDEKGEALPQDLHWRLALAALAASPDEDGELWLLGDGPFDRLAEDHEMIEQLYAEREHNPKVRRLFEAMRRELPNEGVTDGWWFR